MITNINSEDRLVQQTFARSLVQHNREFYGFVRTGVPVEWRDEVGETRYARAQVIDFRNAVNNLSRLRLRRSTIQKRVKPIPS